MEHWRKSSDVSNGVPPDSDTSQGRLYENKVMMGIDINRQELFRIEGED
ncbi:MAG: hypothetical protein M0Z31_01560 [Clostridia bacterium]|nr:hypothetical protein [Clostridia bacterium]